VAGDGKIFESCEFYLAYESVDIEFEMPGLVHGIDFCNIKLQSPVFWAFYLPINNPVVR
jgi:hypothetical protein